MNSGEVLIQDALRGIDISVLTPGNGWLHFAMNETGHLADGIEPVMLLLCTSLHREQASAPPRPVLFVITRISVSVFKSASVVLIAVAPDRFGTAYPVQVMAETNHNIGCSR